MCIYRNVKALLSCKPTAALYENFKVINLIYVVYHSHNKARVVHLSDMVEDEAIVTPTPTPLPLSPLGGDNNDDLLSNHVRYLSLYLGFDHVIGSVAVDGSGLNNDARLTKGNCNTRTIYSLIKFRMT